MIFILGSILLTFLYYSVILPLFLLLLLHREIVNRFAKWVHPSWLPTSIVGGSLATDKLNESGIHCYCLTWEVEKPFDINKWRKRVQGLLASNESPELNCHFTRWMGINFLKPCPPFGTDSLFSINPSSDFKEVQEGIDGFIHEPFNDGEPLWGFRAFPNANERTVPFVLRTHHGLLDALSSIRLLQYICDTNPEEDARVEESISKVMKRFMPPLSLYSKLLIGLELVFLSPFHISYAALKSINWNTWTNPELEGCGQIHYRKKFDYSQIRKLAVKFGYNTNTIFSGALVGAIREEMKDRGESLEKDISLIYVLPSPNHVRKQLTNQLILTPVSIPVSAKDRTERLIKIDEMFRKIRRPAWILQCDITTKFITLIAAVLGAVTKPAWLSSGGWTNVSLFGFESNLKALGRSLKNISVHGGLQVGGVPVMYGVVLLADQVLLTICATDATFPGEIGLKRFSKRVEEELKKLSEM